MFDSEWAHFSDHLQVQWPECLKKILFILSPDDESDSISTLSSTQSANSFVAVENDNLKLDEISEHVQKWLKETIDLFENENTSMIEQVWLVFSLSSTEYVKDFHYFILRD